VPGGDHFFEHNLEDFMDTAKGYLDDRLSQDTPEGNLFF